MTVFSFFRSEKRRALLVTIKIITRTSKDRLQLVTRNYCFIPQDSMVIYKNLRICNFFNYVDLSDLINSSAFYPFEHSTENYCKMPDFVKNRGLIAVTIRIWNSTFTIWKLAKLLGWHG